MEYAAVISIDWTARTISSTFYSLPGAATTAHDYAKTLRKQMPDQAHFVCANEFAINQHELHCALQFKKFVHGS